MRATEKFLRSISDVELLHLLEEQKIGPSRPFEWYGARRERYKEWNGVLEKSVTMNYKISLCAHCMNRIKEAVITVPANINSNLDYPNFEFILLDYNSSDGLEEWVKNNLMVYIDAGILSYYKTEEPKYFRLSHSKNIAMKVANGDIVNAIDIDMLCNKGFISHINKLANQFSSDDKVLFAKRHKLNSRIGFWKRDFLSLGGYDENFIGYGWEDRDLFFRAVESGFTLVLYDPVRYYRYIGGERYKHSSSDRYRNYHPDEKCRPIKNRFDSYCNILRKKFVANEGEHWGKASLIRNFKDEVYI